LPSPLCSPRPVCVKTLILLQCPAFPRHPQPCSRAGSELLSKCPSSAAVWQAGEHRGDTESDPEAWLWGSPRVAELLPALSPGTSRGRVGPLRQTHLKNVAVSFWFSYLPSFRCGTAGGDRGAGLHTAQPARGRAGRWGLSPAEPPARLCAGTGICCPPAAGGLGTAQSPRQHRREGCQLPDVRLPSVSAEGLLLRRARLRGVGARRARVGEQRCCPARAHRGGVGGVVCRGVRGALQVQQRGEAVERVGGVTEGMPGLF